MGIFIRHDVVDSPRCRGRPGTAARELRPWLALYLGCLAVMLLWPFRFEVPGGDAPNGASWRFGLGLEFHRPGVAQSATPTVVPYEQLRRSSAITVEVWAEPDSSRQTGPARLVSSSSGVSNQNLMVGQSGTAAVLRLRTTATDQSGSVGLDREVTEFVAAGAFARPGLRHVVFTHDPGGRRAYVDGRVADAAPSPGGSFASWDEAFPLFLGNGSTGTRPWLGRLALVALYDRALAPGEIAGNFEAGLAAAGRVVDGLVLELRLWAATPRDLALEIPNRLSRSNAPPQLLPFAELARPSARAALEFFGNVLLFVPFGFLLLGSGASGRVAGVATTTLAAVLLSCVMEGAQVFLEPRYSSATDVVSNGLGGALGAVLWRRFARRSSSAVNDFDEAHHDLRGRELQDRQE